MLKLKSMLNGLRKDRRGVTIIEYALAASLISIASITAMSALGTKVSTIMNEISANLK